MYPIPSRALAGKINRFCQKLNRRGGKQSEMYISHSHYLCSQHRTTAPAAISAMTILRASLLAWGTRRVVGEWGFICGRDGMAHTGGARAATHGKTAVYA